MNTLNLAEGMICLVKDGTGCKDAAAQNIDAVLLPGSPVKIVKIEDASCAQKINGECQAPCKCHGCPCTVTAEDAQKNRWTINLIQDKDEDEDASPIVVLEKERIDFLLSKEGLKQYRRCERSDEGFSVKYHGPTAIVSGTLMAVLAFTSKIPKGLLSWAFLVAGSLTALFGLAILLSGIFYNRNPLSLAEQRFFLFYRENQEALQALSDAKTQNEVGKHE